MTITRASGANTIKRIHHRSPPTSKTYNLLMNTIAGGIVEGAVNLGVRLSGFVVKAYTPNPGGSITFGLGAFIHAGPFPAGDHRGVTAEETADITLTASDVETGTALTLWGWVNDASISGSNENAFYRVTPTASPPVPHAVPLSATTHGDLAGAYHWVPQGGAGLVELSSRVSSIVDSGGSPRDYQATAINYWKHHPNYAVMTWCDFGSVDGQLGMWEPTVGDDTKYDIDNRQLKRGTTLTESAYFDSDVFEVAAAPGTYHTLAGARVFWTELDMSGDLFLPDPKYDSVISVIDAAGVVLASFTGVAEFDEDKALAVAHDLTPPNKVAIRVQPANAVDRVFMRAIVLMRMA